MKTSFTVLAMGLLAGCTQAETSSTAAALWGAALATVAGF
jgi:hypothetical protein